MYLVDTNVWLDALMNRPRAQEVADFLSHVRPGELFISTFSLHTIGIVLTDNDEDQAFKDFVRDIVVGRAAGVLTIEPGELGAVVETAGTHGLDFDDAFQYVVAERNNLTLISFDADFDKTPRGRRTPARASNP